MVQSFSETDIPYPRADWAEFVMVSLKTDKELNDAVTKNFELDGSVLKVYVFEFCYKFMLFGLGSNAFIRA